MYLTPDKIEVIPVSPVTRGFDTQKLVVNFHQYPGKNSNRKEAYLFSHSNGFHKESFHPIMRRLIKEIRSKKENDQTDITFITWDARNHGDSARLNEGTYLPDYRWIDNAMDTRHIINYYNLNTDYDQFIGIAHSFGATSMILCEFHHPKSFDGLLLVEPVLSEFMLDEEVRLFNPLLNAIKRRDEWSSRTECKETLLKKKFFQLLHPENLDLYINYGMYETEKGTIKLKCPKEQETHIFNVSAYDIFTAHRTLHTLTLPIHFIYALGSSFMDPDNAFTLTDLNPTRFTLKFLDGTHMVPNEKPDEVVPEIRYLIDRVRNPESISKSKL